MKFYGAFALTSERVLELHLLLEYLRCDDMGGDSIDVFLVLKPVQSRVWSFETCLVLSCSSCLHPKF